MSVSFDDINAMSSLKGIFDDIESGKVDDQIDRAIETGDTTGLKSEQIDVAAMKNILANLYDGNDNILAVDTPVYNDIPKAHHYKSTFDKDDMSYEEYLAMTQGNELQAVDPMSGRPAIKTAPVIVGDEWVLVAESYSGVKSLNMHSIKNSVTGSVILDKITFKESAAAICNMLNAGVSITNPKMLGIISSAVQYTYMVESMVDTLKQKSKVIRESNYDAAKTCDATIIEQKQKASNIRNELLEYMKKHNISYK